MNKSKTYEYRFDSKGNWIHKIICLNNIPSYIIEREINYYN